MNISAESELTPPNQVASTSPTRTSKFGTTPAHWFGRGLLGGVMFVAAANAISYFFRTPGIADLIGPDQNVVEAMGFPYEIWREDKIYAGSLFVDYPKMGLNLLVGIGLGSIFGLVGILLRHRFNRWVEELETKEATHKKIGFQFSVKSLLLVTTVAAMLVAALTSWNGTPQVLMGIYFLGPVVLISIAMLPRRIHWHHRVVVLTVLSAVMIGVAISTGLKLDVPLDRIMLGIFVSWTPQSTFAAFFMVVGLITIGLWSGSLPYAQSELDSETPDQE